MTFLLKPGFWLLLFLLLVGSHDAFAGSVTVLDSAGVKTEGDLLFVRDTALILNSSVTHQNVVIPFSRIRAVVAEGTSLTLPGLIGGAVLGALVAGGSVFTHTGESEVNAAFLAAGVAFFGGLGAGLGDLFSSGPEVVGGLNPDDLLMLKHHARYRGPEPPGLLAGATHSN